MFLLDVVSVNDVKILALSFFQHPHDFFRRVLAVIVQDRHILTPSVAETGQDGAVLTKIPT